MPDLNHSLSRRPGYRRRYPTITMQVTLHSIEETVDRQTIQFFVAFGHDKPSRYLADYDDSDSRIKCYRVEPELFMAISNASYERFGDCTLYQMELMALIDAFVRKELNVKLPVMLGTTEFCGNIPKVWRVIWNKIVGRITVTMWKLGIKRPKEFDLARTKMWDNKALHRKRVNCRFEDLGLSPRLGERGRYLAENN